MNLDVGYTRMIIDYAKSNGVLRNQLAYILATAWHETAFTMKPIREAKGETDDQSIVRLESAYSKGQLPWVRSKYWTKNKEGRSYFGRGFVQLTHETNYAKAGKELDKPLVTNPSLALDPEIATKILVHGMLEGWFTGHKLYNYVLISSSDFYNARKVVNGLDKARDIEKYAKEYDLLLREEGYGNEVEPEPTPLPVASNSFWEFLKRLLNLG